MTFDTTQIRTKFEQTIIIVENKLVQINCILNINDCPLFIHIPIQNQTKNLGVYLHNRLT